MKKYYKETQRESEKGEFTAGQNDLEGVLEAQLVAWSRWSDGWPQALIPSPALTTLPGATLGTEVSAAVTLKIPQIDTKEHVETITDFY